MTVQHEFQAVVLAAGRGSRMPEITAGKPKCLLPIGGKPMVWYPLYKLQQSGFADVILVVSERQRTEIAAVLDKLELAIRIEYACVPDSDDMGTADSLRHIHDRIRTDVIVISCDLLTDVDLGDVIQMYRKHDASVCGLLFPPERPSEPVIVPGPKSKHKPERDLVGIDAQTSRLVFLASASDFESELTLPRALLRKHTNVTMYSNLVDSHLYIMKKWVVNYLQHEETFSTLKGEFLPHIVKKQMAKPARQPITNTSIVDTKDANDIFQFVGRNELQQSIYEASSYSDHIGDVKPCYYGDAVRCYAYVAAPSVFGTRVNTLSAYWTVNGKIADIWEKLTGLKTALMVDPKAEVLSNQVDKCFVWDSACLKEKTSFKNAVIGSNTTVNSYSRVFNSILMNSITLNEKVAVENSIICDGAVIESNCQIKGCIVGSNHVVKEGSQYSNEVLTDSDRLMVF